MSPDLTDDYRRYIDKCLKEVYTAQAVCNYFDSVHINFKFIRQEPMARQFRFISIFFRV